MTRLYGALLARALFVLLLFVPQLGCDAGGLSTIEGYIEVNPGEIDFGDVIGGALSEPTRTIQVINRAEAGSVWLEDVSLLDTADGTFYMVEDDLLSERVRMAPGDILEFRVGVRPTELGSFTDAVMVTPGNDDPINVELFLNVIDEPIPDGLLEPSSLSFGPVTPGSSETLSTFILSVGTADLEVDRVEVVSGAESFSVSLDPSPVSLAPAVDAELSVTYRPLDLGSHTGEVLIYTNDPDTLPGQTESGVLSLTLNGETEPAPDIDPQPIALAFGAVPVGETPTLTSQIHNIGTADLDLGTVTLVGGGPFSIATSPEGSTLPPGEYADLTVEYASDGSSHYGSVLIASNDPDEPTAEVYLTAGFIPEPDIDVDPTSIDFGAVAIGSSATAVVTVSNIGSGMLDVHTVTAPRNPEFEISSLLPGPIGPGASTVVTVTYSPVDDSADSDTVVFRSDDPDEPAVEVLLNAGGESLADLEVTPGAIDFGSIDVGDTTSEVVTLTNVGGADLTVTAVTLDGPGAFSMSPDRSGTPLAPGASTDLTIYYMPDTAVPHVGTLTVASTAEAPILVPLTGGGAGAPDIEASPLAIDFGAVELGDTDSQLLTLGNVGTLDLDISTALLSGSSDFSMSPEISGVMVPPSGFTTLYVYYTPSGMGEDSGTLTIFSNDPDESPLDIPLSGAATGPPDIDVDPTVIDFGVVTVGDSVAQSFEIANVGYSTLSLGLMAYTGDPVFTFGPDYSWGSLEPGASQTVTVNYTATSTTASGGTISIASDDPDEPVVIVRLLATGGSGNNPPVAIADTSPSGISSITTLSTVALDASASYDPDGDPITYAWSLVGAPAGSTSSLSSSSPTPNLNVDLAGTYTLQLTVTDVPAGLTDTDVLVLNATPSEDLWIEMYWTQPDDMDLHLLRLPSASAARTSDDCYYANTNPDWPPSGSGPEDPALDLDDIYGSGPENINISSPAAGTYLIMVHDYPWTETFSGPNSVTVNIYVDGALRRNYVFSISGEDMDYYVASISWPSGVITDY